MKSNENFWLPPIDDRPLSIAGGVTGPNPAIFSTLITALWVIALLLLLLRFAAKAPWKPIAAKIRHLLKGRP